MMRITCHQKVTVNRQKVIEIKLKIGRLSRYRKIYSRGTEILFPVSARKLRQHDQALKAARDVTVGDGTKSCTGTVAVGSCTITFATVGIKSLVADYAGDATFAASTSAAYSHEVTLVVTVADDTCSIAFNIGGTKSLVASYEGDAMHAPSQSAPFDHTVNTPPPVVPAKPIPTLSQWALLLLGLLLGMVAVVSLRRNTQ